MAHACTSLPLVCSSPLRHCLKYSNDVLQKSFWISSKSEENPFPDHSRWEKKKQKRRRGLDNLKGVGAGFLTPIPAMGSVPMPVLILQISATHMGMNYSHDWELVKDLKINPCIRVLITLKICPQSFIGRKSEQAIMWWRGNDHSGLHFCLLSLRDQLCPEYSSMHQASIQQSIWEHFALSRHLNLLLVSVGHRQLLKHFIEQE